VEQIGARRDVRGCVRSDGSTLRLVLTATNARERGCGLSDPASSSGPFTMGWQCELNDPCHAADTTVERTVRRLIESPRGGRACAWLGRSGPAPRMA